MTYSAQLQTALKKQADAAEAPAMSAYVKEHFPFFGIKAGLRREVLKAFIVEHGLPSSEDLAGTVRKLWQMPERECHYCGQELALRVWRKPPVDALDLYLHMIVHQSWWDTVDMIATKLVAGYFKHHPTEESGLCRDWYASDHVWLKRTALLFQLKRKERTNWPLLEETMLACASHPDFFVRKAIGWALREYARTDSQAVVEFVDACPELSSLSRREALRGMD